VGVGLAHSRSGKEVSLERVRGRKVGDDIRADNGLAATRPHRPLSGLLAFTWRSQRGRNWEKNDTTTFNLSSF
jgi:hypothetical protein